jgi:ribosomal protein S18 acetylase RimI-like enzyme
MIKLEALTGHHEKKPFDCGVEALNTWLGQTALQHQTKGISRTFVAVPLDRPDQVFGYYALASAFVMVEDLPPKLAKRYPRQIPVTRLGRLAVSAHLHGQGLDKLLLADALTKSKNAAQTVGSAGIIVDAKDQTAASFYRRYGFVTCGEQSLKLFLAMW